MGLNGPYLTPNMPIIGLKWALLDPYLTPFGPLNGPLWLNPLLVLLREA